ncbi:uncharacterized protein LOC135939682 isoform X3 [Cloeon dipterum]|uniref:uncharacterized protein LOC135939682 isoform X3 n=1 Tax=Cloeon dipterum TaxID=197152 RepID=UPI00321F9717
MLMDQFPNEMSSKYALQPLAKSQIPKLLEILKSLLPDSIIAYHWLLNGSRWIDGHGLDSKILILCPNGDTNDGSMVGLIDGLAGHNKIFGTVYVQPENMDKMKIAIKETEHIEWERLKHLIGVWRRFVPHLSEVMRAKGVEFTENYRTVNAMTILKAASLPSPKIPENIRVGPLDGSHLDVFCDNWPHYDPEFRPVIEKMLQCNPSVGGLRWDWASTDYPRTPTKRLRRNRFGYPDENAR